MRVMTNQSIQLVITASALAVGVANFAFGGGGAGVGDGGDTIQLADGTWRLADPYVVPAAPGAGVHYHDLNPNITHEIELVGQLLVRLGAAVSDRLPPLPPGAPPMTINQQIAARARLKLQGEISRSAQASFVTEYMADDNITYYFVDQLPTGCWTPGDVQLPHPAASPGPSPAPAPQVVQAGCTQGSSTFLIKDIFDNMPIHGDATDPREQVKFLIHERLHGIDTVGEEPSYIADVTNGVDLLLDLHFAEQAGKRPVLNDTQLQTLRTLISRIGYTYNSLTADQTLKSEEFQDGGEWHISPNGGGLYSAYAQVAPDAYLGVGSLLSDGGVLGSGATMINSSCYLVSCVVGANGTLMNSVITPNASSRPSSPEEVSPGDSYTDQLFTAQFGPKSSLSGVTLKTDLPVPGPTAPASSSPEISVGDGSVLQKVEVSAVTAFSTGPRATMSGDILDFGVNAAVATDLSLGEQASVSGLSTFFRTSLAPGAAARALEFSSAAKLVFPAGTPPCPGALTPMLDASAAVDSVAAFRGLCGSPMAPQTTPGGR